MKTSKFAFQINWSLATSRQNNWGRIFGLAWLKFPVVPLQSAHLARSFQPPPIFPGKKYSTFQFYNTLAKTAIYPKNVRAKVAMDFT